MSDISSGVNGKFMRYLSPFSGKEARRMRVGKCVTASFHQIADAIRASRPYDCIEVESGKYFESLMIKHPLELRSAKDGEPPVIISRGPCLKITTDGPVCLQSLVIVAKGTKDSDSQGILIEHGSPIIEDCEISSVYVMNDASPQISHCHICNSDYGYGLCLTGSSGGVYTNNDISYHNDQCVCINTNGKPDIHHNRISQKKGQNNMAVLISGRLLSCCEPHFWDNIIQGGGGAVNNEQIDPVSVHFPKMLYENKSSELACLVSVTDGATPFLRGNLLCNGVTGFYFRGCSLPSDYFCNNRVMNCTAWGIVITEKTSLVVRDSDIQRCGGGIYVSLNSPVDTSGTTPHRLTLSKCHVTKNLYYGILINHSAITVNDCNLSEGSVGIALLGNCATSAITKNTLSGNTVAAFAVLHHGVAVIEENTVHGCKKSAYGVFVQDGSNLTLRANYIEGTSTSVFLRDGSQLVAVKNELRKASVHHVVLTERSNATLQKNIIEGNACASIVVTKHSECIAYENVILSGLLEGILVEEKGKATIERNSMSSLREAIFVKTGGSVHVEDNDITLSQNGVVVEGKESKCTVVGNRFRGTRELAIYVLDNASLIAQKNLVTDFLAVGIQIGLGAKALVERNKFTNGGDGAICVDGAGTECDVLYCHMEDVGYGVSFTRCSTGTIKGNQIGRCKYFGIACNSNGSLSVYDNNISGSCIGIEIISGDNIYNNSIEDCKVGIMARECAIGEVKNHHITNCTVGVSLMRQTCVKFTAITVQKSKEYGFLVGGPCADVTVSRSTLENCRVAGVLVQKDGECRFEQCILRHNKEEGIWLQSAGAVVFEQCTIVGQSRGVKATGSHGTFWATDEPLLVNCTIDGDLCEEGVLSMAGGVVRLNLCSISARYPQKGSGVVVYDNGKVQLSHCNVSGCPKVGVVASPSSRLMVEHTTISNCGTGAFFTSVQEGEAHLQDNKADNKSSTNIFNSSDSFIAGPPKVTQLTIMGCSEAGIVFESYGKGVVDCTTVTDCATGIIVHQKSLVMLTSTVVRGSKGSGILLFGLPSTNSVLNRLTISDSGDCGMRVNKAVDNIIDGDVGDEIPPLTIQDSEMLRNAKGGAVIEVCVYLDKCTFDNNAAIGVICQGNCRPVFSSCHLTHNVGLNLETRRGSVPELRDCVVEHSAVGVHVHSALSMTRCIARELGVAVNFDINVEEAESSKFLECEFSNNTKGICCAGNVCKSNLKHILMENCLFQGNSCTSVCVNKGGPEALLRDCIFEMSCEGVNVGDGAVAVIETCNFKGNTKAITLSNVENVEVKNSTFVMQTHYGIGVMGNNGTVRICYNSFRENRRHGISLSAKGAVVVVNNNYFEGDTCGIFIQETPELYIYNNCFRAFQTGILLNGEGFCGNIFSNRIEEGTCGCRIEENATAHLWRNEFKENKEYGILSTTGAKPIVVDSTFLDHRATNSSALCVCNGGAGHYAFNQYTKNVCGVQLEETSGTVVINNSTFDANEVAIQLKEKAAVHVLACTFAAGLSSDITALGSIEDDQCVLAYNCFASKKCTAITVGKHAAVVIYRNIFFGAGGKGVVQCRYGKSLVSECLFYELDRGVLATESGGGNVIKSVFVYCGTAVELYSLASTVFHSCAFLAPPSNVTPVVIVHHAATPAFHKCSFMGFSTMKNSILQSGGGGVVEDSSFIAGDLAVVVEKDCTMMLRRNTFLRGGIGVKFEARSRAKVEHNVFHQHRVTAVNLMDNAGGELTENMFAQLPENGGILMGTHNVTVGPCKPLDDRSAKAAKKIKEESFMQDLIAAFVTSLSEGPYWVRKGMGETLHVATLPPSILAALRRPEVVTDEGNKTQSVTTEEKGKAEEEEGSSQKVTRPLAQKRGGGAKNRDKVRQTKKIEPFFFSVSDTTVCLPQNMQNTLSTWVEHQGITLNVKKIQRPAVPEASEKKCVTEILQEVSERLTTMAEVRCAEKRGNFDIDQCKKVRGAVAREESPDDSKKISLVEAKTESQKDLTTSNIEQKQESFNLSTSTKHVHCTQHPATAGSFKISEEKERKVRKRRKFLQPPLKSKGKNAESTHKPHYGPLVTVAGCLRGCAVEGHRKPKKKASSEEFCIVSDEALKLGLSQREDKNLCVSFSEIVDENKSENPDPFFSNEEKITWSSPGDLSRSTVHLSRALKGMEESQCRAEPQMLVSFENNTDGFGFQEQRDKMSLCSSRNLRDGNSLLGLSNIRGGEQQVEHEVGVTRSKTTSVLDSFSFKEPKVQETDRSNSGGVYALAVWDSVGSVHNDPTPMDSGKFCAKDMPLVGERSPNKGIFQNILEQENFETPGFDGKEPRKQTKKKFRKNNAKKIAKGHLKEKSTSLAFATNDSELLGSPAFMTKATFGSLVLPADNEVTAEVCRDLTVSSSKGELMSKSSVVPAVFENFLQLQGRSEVNATLSPSSMSKLKVTEESVLLSSSQHEDTTVTTPHTKEVQKNAAPPHAKNRRKALVKLLSPSRRAPGSPTERCGTAAPSDVADDRSTATFGTLASPQQSTVGSAFAVSIPGEGTTNEKLTASVNSTQLTHQSTTTNRTFLEAKAQELAEEDKDALEEKKRRLKKSSTVRFPKLTASSLRDAHLIEKNAKAHTTTEKPVAPPLSKKGLDLLEAIEDTLLQGDILLQEEEVYAVSIGHGGKTSPAFEKITPTEPLSDVMDTTDKKTVTEKSLKDEEEVEEVEDIIALLRWLADLREQKFLSQQRFTVAVECIRANTNVPFFICEEGSTGNGPVVMLRLPQTTDETVVVPLLGMPIDMRNLTQLAEGESESIRSTQPRRINLKGPNVFCKMDTEFKKQNAWWISKGGDVDSGDVNERAKSSENVENGLAIGLSSSITKPKFSSVHEKLPLGRFKKDEYRSLAVGTVFSAKQLSETSLHGLGILSVSEGQTMVRNVVNTETFKSKTLKQKPSFYPPIQNVNRQGVLRFNPAIPKETSPFNKTPRVAAFIAAGTSNLTM